MVSKLSNRVITTATKVIMLQKTIASENEKFMLKKLGMSKAHTDKILDTLEETRWVYFNTEPSVLHHREGDWTSQARESKIERGHTESATIRQAKHLCEHRTCGTFSWHNTVSRASVKATLLNSAISSSPWVDLR